jgi:hypothetical protein
MASMPRLFSRTIAERFVSQRDFEAARQFFIEEKPQLTAEVVLRLRGYTRVLLKENPDNYGLYFINPGAPVPFLWLGMGWSADDPAGTLPSWGVSMEVNGSYVRPFTENAGGLLDACRAVEAQSETIQLHHFEQHVELAEWRDFDWLLSEEDHALALARFWAGYLRALTDAEVPAAIVAFTRECGIS